MGRFALVLLLAVFALASGCSSNEIISDQQISVAAYRKITAEQAKEIIDGDEPFIVLDVRTDAEFREYRIDGAVLIPHFEIKERAPNELPDKDTLILIYCLRGARSYEAAKELVNMGYTKVYDFGGIADWVYETVSGGA